MRAAAQCRSLASLIELQAKHESKTVLDVFEELASYAAGEFRQKITVDGDDLRQISHRVFRQACGFGREQHVARGIDETSVGAQHDGNDRLHAAPVEGIALQRKLANNASHQTAADVISSGRW